MIASIAKDTIYAVKIRYNISKDWKAKYAIATITSAQNQNLRNAILSKTKLDIPCFLSFSLALSDSICFSNFSSSASCFLLSDLKDLKKSDPH